MQETKLELELKAAKTKQVIENLLCICDKIHEGFSVDGYSIDDLPPDYVYTEYCKIVNHDTNSVTKTTIMNMATIPKPEKLSILGSVLVYPKFDGCSIAIRFIKDNDVKCIYKVEQAHTRGQNKGNERLNTDVTLKMQKLFKNIVAKSSFYNSINAINIRGEFIIRHRNVDENYNPVIPHCPQAAGILNGLMNNFESHINDVCLVCYEISKIETVDKQIVIPKQGDVNRYLNKLYFIYNDDHQQRSDDYTYYSILFNESTSPEKVYLKVLNSTDYPTDGFVYCKNDWLYPQSEKEFTNANYEKFAWKPTSFNITSINGFDYTMSRDGELRIQLLLKPVKINGTNRLRSNIAVSKLHKLIRLGLGINSVVEVRLIHNINVTIDNILEKAKSPFNLPRLCPFCGSELEQVFDKKNPDKLIHIYCRSNTCSEQRIIKLAFLITTVHKLVGLTFLNDKGKQIKSPINEKKLKNMQDTTLQTLLHYIPDLQEKFISLDFENQYVALSLGGIEEARKVPNEEKNIRNFESWFNELYK